jgi:hypothetical protein
MKKQIQYLFLLLSTVSLFGCFTKDLVFPTNENSRKKITHIEMKDKSLLQFTDDSLSTAYLEKDHILVNRKYGDKMQIPLTDVLTAEYEHMNIPLTLLYLGGLGCIYYLVLKNN